MKRINVNGTIIPSGDAWIYRFFGMEATCPADVEKVLNEADGDDVEVTINSGGGSVFAGTEIYTKLRSYKGKILIRIQSMAASAAAVIAMAGESEISPVAQLMIHNVSSGASGDNRDMEHMAEVLKTANRSLASAFTAKTGKTEAEILKMMDHETWMTAQRAVEEGFVDRIMFEEKKAFEPGQLAASYGGGLLPQNVLDYARNHIKNPENQQTNLGLQLELLKLEERK